MRIRIAKKIIKRGGMTTNAFNRFWSYWVRYHGLPKTKAAWDAFLKETNA